MVPFLVEIFAVRTRAQWIYKPLLVYAALILLSLSAQVLFKPSDENIPLPQLMIIVLFISAPFVTIGFMIISHLEDLQRKLAVLASTDLLTELPNRRAFLETLRQSIKAGEPGTLILLDADHFKRINDTYGHGVGDICLQAIADRMRAVMKPHYSAARLGGEEFCVYLPKANAEEAKLIADALIAPIEVDGNIAMTLSAGIAQTEGGIETKALIQRADEALYRAKNAGRARYVVWS